MKASEAEGMNVVLLILWLIAVGLCLSTGSFTSQKKNEIVGVTGVVLGALVFSWLLWEIVTIH